MLTAREIVDHPSKLFRHLDGDLARIVTQCRSADEPTEGCLVFCDLRGQLDLALERKAGVIVLGPTLAATFSPGNHEGCFLAVTHVRAGMGELLCYFDGKAERFEQWGGHHPTAIVHPTAQIGARVRLGPCCVIGARVIIGDDSRIGAHVVVENDARIGAGSTLHPQVFVGARCELGERCEIHPHTSIGSDGFAYTRDASGKPVKIAQIGIVRIGDDVEIGSNCAIDRATLTATVIRSGVKIDNICHIAHNCDLGENGFYTAGFMMAGSTKIGRNFVTGGNSVVAGHLTLADNVELAGRSTVTNDIKQGGQYGGYPLQPLRDALKTLVSLTKLTEMRKKLNSLST